MAVGAAVGNEITPLSVSEPTKIPLTSNISKAVALGLTYPLKCLILDPV
jgi:hypothetical protein